MRLLILFFVILSLAACRPAANNSGGKPAADTLAADTAIALQPSYAKGFRVTHRDDGVRLVDIQDPQNESSTTYHIALVPRQADGVAVPDGYVSIPTPVRSLVCMTTLQLSNFICLDALDCVRGIPSTRHLFNEDVKQRLDDGKTLRIGIEGQFDTETIIAMQPDAILVSPSKRGGYDALAETGIPLVPHLGYNETSPLGQAEWIKFVGMLCGLEARALECFAAIEQRYLQLRQLASGAEQRPVVMSGEMRSGTWYAVGGESFLAQMFRDAGADYFLREDTHTGGVSLDFETVYGKAAEADFWRIVNSYDGDYSYDALLASDERYADFRAFRQRGVLYCNMSQTPFYENMPVQPDQVLADLIFAFHPNLLPDHKPIYYRLLK